jgi:hypothetical protein
MDDKIPPYHILSPITLGPSFHFRNEPADIAYKPWNSYNDLSYLRKQAKENLQNHIQERIPEEYQKAVVGINKVLKTCWNIINKDTTDDKTKLQATAIINDSYKYLMDLTTNGVVITDAIRFFQTNKEKLTMSTNKDQNGKESEEPDYGEDELEEKRETEFNQETTNNVF